MGKLDKIRWHIGGKKPVEWDLTKLKTIDLPLLGPVKVEWRTRSLLTDKITEHQAMMYWQGDELYQLEATSPVAGHCEPLLIFIGQPISVSNNVYKVEMMEPFTLPPSRIFSPFEGMISFSYTGFSGFRYLVKKE